MTSQGNPLVHTPGSTPEPVSEAPLWKDGDPAVGLYVHVPFCRAICTYCAFAKGEYDAGRADTWLSALEHEVKVRAADTWAGRPTLDTVFLGGGTPSTLSLAQWRRDGRRERISARTAARRRLYAWNLGH